MAKFCAYISSLWLGFIVVSLAGPSVQNCELLDVSTTNSTGKLIKVGCDGRTIVVNLKEGGSESMLKVIGEHGRNLLTVDYLENSHDMFIVIDGKKFNVKNEKTKAEEAKRFKKLLDDPEFKFFPKAVRLIHDELKLKGWKSPSVMFLYRIGISAGEYYAKTNKQTDILLQKRFNFFGLFNTAKVDSQTYDYHGPNPKKKCAYNGWSDPSMDHLIKTECLGVCGQGCKACWKWVCGDCCMHHGCKRHDEYCEKSFLNPNCVGLRGVVWDTRTGVYRDCL